jgi:hypothetical protein
MPELPSRRDLPVGPGLSGCVCRRSAHRDRRSGAAPSGARPNPASGDEPANRPGAARPSLCEVGARYGLPGSARQSQRPIRCNAAGRSTGHRATRDFSSKWAATRTPIKRIRRRCQIAIQRFLCEPGALARGLTAETRFGSRFCASLQGSRLGPRNSKELPRHSPILRQKLAGESAAD